MRDVPRYFDEHIVNMRAGLERGFSVPRVTLEGRDASLVPLTSPDPAENPFYDAFQDMPASIPEAEQAPLRAEADPGIERRGVMMGQCVDRRFDVRGGRRMKK